MVDTVDVVFNYVDFVVQQATIKENVLCLTDQYNQSKMYHCQHPKIAKNMVSSCLLLIVLHLYVQLLIQMETNLKRMSSQLYRLKESPKLRLGLKLKRFPSTNWY